MLWFRFVGHESLSFRRLLRRLNPSGRGLARGEGGWNSGDGHCYFLLPIERLASWYRGLQISNHGFLLCVPTWIPSLLGFCVGMDGLDIMMSQPRSILACKQTLPLKWHVVEMQGLGAWWLLSKVVTKPLYFELITAAHNAKMVYS